MKALDAKGVAVTIDAAHQCMTMRGIKKERATTVTNYFLGSFKEDLSIQNRYLRYIAKQMANKFKAVVIDNQNEKFTRDIKEIDTSHLKLKRLYNLNLNNRL